MCVLPVEDVVLFWEDPVYNNVHVHIYCVCVCIMFRSVYECVRITCGGSCSISGTSCV